MSFPGLKSVLNLRDFHNLDPRLLILDRELLILDPELLILDPELLIL